MESRLIALQIRGLNWKLNLFIKFGFLRARVFFKGCAPVRRCAAIHPEMLRHSLVVANIFLQIIPS